MLVRFLSKEDRKSFVEGVFGHLGIEARQERPADSQRRFLRLRAGPIQPEGHGAQLPGARRPSEPECDNAWTHLGELHPVHQPGSRTQNWAATAKKERRHRRFETRRTTRWHPRVAQRSFRILSKEQRGVPTSSARSIAARATSQLAGSCIPSRAPRKFSATSFDITVEARASTELLAGGWVADDANPSAAVVSAAAAVSKSRMGLRRMLRAVELNISPRRISAITAKRWRMGTTWAERFRGVAGGGHGEGHIGAAG